MDFLKLCNSNEDDQGRMVLPDRCIEVCWLNAVIRQL